MSALTERVEEARKGLRDSAEALRHVLAWRDPAALDAVHDVVGKISVALDCLLEEADEVERQRREIAADQGLSALLDAVAARVAARIKEAP